MSDETARVLITGGAGFIGSNLATRMKNDGLQPVIYDINNDSGLKTRLGKDVEVIKGDVRDFDKLSQVIESVDGIVHLAAVSRVIWGYENPRECVDVNIRGTSNVLEGARKAVTRPWVIYGSSREVYGEAEKLPVHESFQKRVVNVYGMTKIAGENLCHQYHENYGVDIGILRFSNVYGGVNDHLDRVIPKFVISALLGQRIVIHGGNQLFDFTHISDTLDGITRMIERLSSNNGPYCDDFHILRGEPTSLQELVSIIHLNTGNSSDIVYGPSRTYDVERFYGNPAKAREHLGFDARIGIEDGIRSYVPLLREYLEENEDGASERCRQERIE